MVGGKNDSVGIYSLSMILWLWDGSRGGGGGEGVEVLEEKCQVSVLSAEDAGRSRM